MKRVDEKPTLVKGPKLQSVTAVKAASGVVVE
jgi:hypothetical protein